MIHTTIKLPRWRLNIRRALGGRRRAKKLGILLYLNTIKGFRAGNKLSRITRHILERVNIKAFLGGNLALFIVVSNVLVPGAAALGQVEPEQTLLVVPEEPISTEVAVQYPVELVIVNQGFHLLHWGVDFDGVKGDPIRPIKKGKVIKTESSRFAFGNSALIEHGDGFSSLYAHLSEINVKEDDQVDTRTVIGKMGRTGNATGDHLHLEVYKNGRPVNPFSILPRR